MMFIETEETTKEFTPRIVSSLTKVSGTGDSTITYIKFNNFQHYGVITNTDTRKFTGMIAKKFTEIQFRVELVSENGQYTPELNDFTFLYDEVEND